MKKNEYRYTKRRFPFFKKEEKVFHYASDSIEPCANKSCINFKKYYISSMPGFHIPPYSIFMCLTCSEFKQKMNYVNKEEEYATK